MNLLVVVYFEAHWCCFTVTLAQLQGHPGAEGMAQSTLDIHTLKDVSLDYILGCTPWNRLAS